MALTKNGIAEEIAKIGYSKEKSFQITEALIEIIKEGLSTDKEVLISGFGKFTVKSKQSRRGRNPASGESIILPGRRVIVFKCSEKLRKIINR